MRRLTAILLLTILTAMPVQADELGKKQKTPEQVAIERRNRK